MRSKIEKAIIAGFDWGARTANIVAALWPERCKALVSVSGYLIGSQEANQMPLPPQAELAMVVSVLLRDRARPRGLREVPARVREADLADRLAAVGLRRRDVRPQRRVVRQSGSRQHRDPQLPLAARPGRRRADVRRRSRRGWPRPGHHACPRSRSKAMPTARRIRLRPPMPRSSRASTRTGT